MINCIVLSNGKNLRSCERFILLNLAVGNNVTIRTIKKGIQGLDIIEIKFDQLEEIPSATINNK